MLILKYFHSIVEIIIIFLKRINPTLELYYCNSVGTVVSHVLIIAQSSRADHFQSISYFFSLNELKETIKFLFIYSSDLEFC